MPSQYVVLPEPGGPITICPKIVGILCSKLFTTLDQFYRTVLIFQVEWKCLVTADFLWDASKNFVDDWNLKAAQVFDLKKKLRM